MTNRVFDERIEQAVLTIDSEIFFSTGIHLSDYEKSILSEGILFAKTQTPNNYAVVMDSMETLTKLESEYNYIIYSLSRQLEEANFEFRTHYDNLFATLSRAGRTLAAAESEALSKDGNKLLNLKNKINRLENVINYLKSEVLILRSKLKTFDAKRSNTF